MVCVCDGDTMLQFVYEVSDASSKVKMVNQGDCIGYNRTYRASDYIWVATLGVGYADGFSRAFSSGLGGAANCSVMMHYASGGQRGSVACDVVGRVSMDAITVRAAARACGCGCGCGCSCPAALLICFV